MFGLVAVRERHKPGRRHRVREGQFVVAVQPGDVADRAAFGHPDRTVRTESWPEFFGSRDRAVFGRPQTQDVVVVESLERVRGPVSDHATGCLARSAERRVGNEGVRTCRSWWAPE